MSPDDLKAEKPRAGERLNQPLALSHGTIECRSFAASRPFYEEFLGLETVRHYKVSMLMRFPKNDWVVVCMQVGAKAHGNHRLNHWGLDLGSRAEVDAAHARAIKYKERYGIGRITKPNGQHGNYGFYLRDLDDNWWEFQYVAPGMAYEEKFQRGDQFPD